jgi:hypothetical protein
MKFSAADLVVILDTLVGSSRISDNGSIFTYTESTRRKVLDKINQLMCEIEINIDASTPDPITLTSDTGV